MRRTPRYLLVAFPVVVLVGAFCLAPLSHHPDRASRATVEPSLPLTIDLRALPGDARGGPPRLQTVLESADEVQDLTLSLVLPADLSAGAGELPERPGRLGRGEKRVYLLPIQARRDGAYPVRLEATFRLPGGQVVRTQQGMVWKSGPSGQEGRHHAGAYEWYGVQVGEPQP